MLGSPLFIPGPVEGIQKVVNEATDVEFGE